MNTTNQPKSIEHAIKDCSTVDFNNPEELKTMKHIDNIFQNANIMVMIKSYEKATELYTRVLKHNPWHLNAYNNRAVAYKEIGENILAEHDMEAVKFLKEKLYIPTEVLTHTNSL